MAEQLIDAKYKKYGELISQGNFKFVPFVCEAFGGISEPALRILRRLANDLQEKTKRCFSSIMASLQKCICVIIWKSVVESVMERAFWIKSNGFQQT